MTRRHEILRRTIGSGIVAHLPALAVRPTGSLSQPGAAEFQSTNGLNAAFVDSLVRREAMLRGVPALAVSVYSCGRPIVVRAWGNAAVDPKRSATTTTPFNIASLTKPFTSTVVLHLVRTGVLKLDAPVQQYLQWLPKQYATITIRQLLGHTSGIVRDVRRDNSDDPDEPEYQARVIASEASSAPGTRFEYSNTGLGSGPARERIGGCVPHVRRTRLIRHGLVRRRLQWAQDHQSRRWNHGLRVAIPALPRRSVNDRRAFEHQVSG